MYKKDEEESEFGCICVRDLQRLLLQLDRSALRFAVPVAKCYLFSGICTLTYSWNCNLVNVIYLSKFRLYELDFLRCKAVQ